MGSVSHMEKAVLKFVNTLFAGKFAEAERILNKIAKRASTEEERRAVHALRGILNAYQLDDRDSLVYRIFIEGNPAMAAKKIKDSLLQHINTNNAESDAYYAIWLLILNNIKKIRVPHRLAETEPRETETTQA
ncbi:MAG: hypothetical protein QXW60_02985 [Nitrososphaerota archaeon]